MRFTLRWIPLDAVTTQRHGNQVRGQWARRRHGLMQIIAGGDECAARTRQPLRRRDGRRRRRGDRQSGGRSAVRFPQRSSCSFTTRMRSAPIAGRANWSGGCRTPASARGLRMSTRLRTSKARSRVTAGRMSRVHWSAESISRIWHWRASRGRERRRSTRRIFHRIHRRLWFVAHPAMHRSGFRRIRAAECCTMLIIGPTGAGKSVLLAHHGDGLDRRSKARVCAGSISTTRRLSPRMHSEPTTAISAMRARPRSVPLEHAGESETKMNSCWPSSSASSRAGRPRSAPNNRKNLARAIELWAGEGLRRMRYLSGTDAGPRRSAEF